MRPLLLTALLAATPAFAQDRPPIFPTRDVAITYRMSSGQLQQGAPSMTMSWLAAAQTMRMDMPGMGFIVADHRNQRGFMAVEAARMVMDIPMAQATQVGPTANSTFRRTGSDTVAGLPCTVWSYQDGSSQGTACLTAEGVMLRAQGSAQGHSGTMEATQVVFGTQDPARFQRPQGFQTMQLPAGALPGQRPPAK